MDHALGAIVGAAVGDAVGAFLEFEHSISPADVQAALALPGGGCWGVGPGQFTDDTELALCLARGLAGQPPSAGFPEDPVAREYAWWYNASGPFDVGTATASAFRVAGFGGAAPEGGYAAALRANVRGPVSQGSKANGALMRATPLAVWAHRLPDAAIAACARADAQLSHPNQACQDASAAYVLAAASLIRRPGDAAAALAAAEGWAAAHACPEVRDWLAAAADDAALAGYDASPQMGFAKHALLLAFHHLRRRSTFSEALRHTLQCGGDTDTNAAIVCGLLGALHGLSGIPADLAFKVESYRFDGDEQQGGPPPGLPAARRHGQGTVRPERLHGSQLRPLAERLYADALADSQPG